MEQWVDQVAASLDNSRLHRLTMMDYVDVVEEEVVEGMEEEEHGHEHSHEEEEAGEFDAHDGQELDIEYDEHIWTSPVNSMKIVEIISDTLAEMDPANEAYYRENAASYLEELSALDEQFNKICDGSGAWLCIGTAAGKCSPVGQTIRIRKIPKRKFIRQHHHPVAAI